MWTNILVLPPLFIQRCNDLIIKSKREYSSKRNFLIIILGIRCIRYWYT